jgi:hypothetical protein
MLKFVQHPVFAELVPEARQVQFPGGPLLTPPSALQ